jgi:hypothetical protein
MKSIAGRIGRPFAVVVPVLIVALAALPRGDTSVSSRLERTRCTASIDPDTVSVLQEPITLHYMVPDSVGAISAVTAPEDSGLRIGTVNPDSRTVGLDTSGAIEGEWTLSFTGTEQRTCSGTLSVRMADAGRS